uniref:Uncharacterized protein n=1 Tax=Onchocerca volvulus TaxID=6282 RepID=A0A8R1XXR1_ONCVO
SAPPGHSEFHFAIINDFPDKIHLQQFSHQCTAIMEIISENSEDNQMDGTESQSCQCHRSLIFVKLTLFISCDFLGEKKKKKRKEKQKS